MNTTQLYIFDVYDSRGTLELCTELTCLLGRMINKEDEKLSNIYFTIYFLKLKSISSNLFPNPQPPNQKQALFLTPSVVLKPLNIRKKLSGASVSALPLVVTSRSTPHLQLCTFLTVAVGYVALNH